MGIKDRMRMDEIRKLFLSDGFVFKPLSKASIVRLLSSMNRKKQTQGMRSLVSGMQYGEDMSEMYNEIIKVIDTRDVELKRLLNLYLLRYTQGWPAKQLICIHTFLKDFGDEISGIRYCAIEDSGLLGDGTIIRNYINPMMMHGDDESVETRCKVAESLRNYFMTDPKLFLDEGMCDILKKLSSDIDPRVCACSVASIRRIEREMKILSVVEINKLLDEYISSCNTETLGSLLGLMKNRIKDISNITPLIPLLTSCNLHIFYLSSSLIISMDPSYKQVVFDQVRGFLDCKDEELYLVLEYIESLIMDVHYESSYFVIYQDDKKYNKIKKLLLLFKRLDDVSISEIRRQCGDRDMIGVILREALNVD